MTEKDIQKIVKQELEIYDFNDQFDYDRASLNIAKKLTIPLDGERNEMLWNWKNFIDLNDNMSFEHIYQMLKDLDDRLQKMDR